MSFFGPGWLPPPSEPVLASNDVHVWLASLDQPPAVQAVLAATLSAEERERASRFYFERDRQRFAAGRGLLRVVIGRYLERAPAWLAISYGPRGKPALAMPGAADLRFNVSHSGGLWLLALAHGREVGADIEQVRPVANRDGIAGRFFSTGEREALRGAPEAQRDLAFFQCWTRKEAYIKGTGDGLARPLQRFEVSLAAAGPSPLLGVAGEPGEGDRWRIYPLEPAEGYVAAVAVEGPEAAITTYRFE